MNKMDRSNGKESTTIRHGSDVGINPALAGNGLKNKWKTKQLDYVLAFPQAPVTENAS
jgi:hypothetical protein